MASFHRVSMSDFRVGHLGAARANKRASGLVPTKRDDCSSGGFYTAPTAQDKIDALQPLTVSWNNKCLTDNPQYVDLYLYAPARDNSLIQAFDSADYAKGSMEMNLKPEWWGSNTTVQLQLSIVSHGTQPFMSPLPAGPVFTATFDPNSPNAPKPGDSSDNGDGSVAQRVKNALSGLSPGAKAAAAIFPILAVLGIIAFFVIRKKRAARAAKTNRFSQTLDKRMSRMSGNWRPTSGVPGAGNRNSEMPRFSGYGYDYDNRASAYSASGGVAGGILMSQKNESTGRFSTYNAGDRVSRVSFAPTTNQSEKERPPIPGNADSRYFAGQSYYYADGYDGEEANRDLAMSPTQQHGAQMLHPGDIHARVSASDDDADLRRSMLQMPALSLVRTSDDQDRLSAADPDRPVSILMNGKNSPSQHQDQYIVEPSVPAPAAVKGGASAQQRSLLSPDAAMRAYAAGNPRAATPASGGGMRVLHSNTGTPEPSMGYGSQQHPVSADDMQAFAYAHPGQQVNSMYGEYDYNDPNYHQDGQQKTNYRM